jgi:hypothetical protein
MLFLAYLVDFRRRLSGNVRANHGETNIPGRAHP